MGGKGGGGSDQTDAANVASKAALTGYNFLRGPVGGQLIQPYINSGQQALAQGGAARQMMAGLLGVPQQSGGTAPTVYQPNGDAPQPPPSTGAQPFPGIGPQSQPGKFQTPATAAPASGQQPGGFPGIQMVPTGPAAGGVSPQQTNDAFHNYLNSTAYQFQLGQGLNAINSNAAARGLLGSGGTAKGLEQYGQNLAGTTFNNYLNQLGAVNARNQAAAEQGRAAIGQIAGAGSQGGGSAAQAITAGAANQATVDSANQASNSKLLGTAGAAIGTAVMPGIGTVIGGLAGNVLGGIL